MQVKADLHIHSVLSPCGDLTMSPTAIVEQAKMLELDVIAITDHNSTLNAEVAAQIGERKDLFVMMGAEVTTKEEVHSLCYMPDTDRLKSFQEFLDSKVVFLENSVEKFGYQLVVDKDENIVDEVPHLLINALNLSINELQKKVKELDGIFVPAHVDKKDTSLSSQLFFVPEDLDFDALELSPYYQRNEFFDRFPWFKGYTYITDSDAHFIHDIGKAFNTFELEEVNFESLREAIQKGSLKITDAYKS